MSRRDAPVCVLIGGGGHARVIIDALQASGDPRPLGILDAAPELLGTTVFGVPVYGDDTLLPDLVKRGTSHFIVTVGSIGDARLRSTLFERARALGLEAVTVRHPSAVVSPWATIGPGVQLLPAAVVNAGARIGENVIVNSGAIVEHDCTIGDHVHIATGARLASSVNIGTGAHIGAGAVLRQGITVGSRAVIGAGAVVVKDVPADTVVAGNPARPLP